ncbi:helix-turn-helix domain-containing protein [Anaerocolumna sedimenticola]|uniref:Helix-turn-helix domain-containing protein n=2 Tax=Anaerocolumna sedimenticola TaxID=2696063 RepID=A0A6P1TTW0_9FIRM|nr:AraC family transcriptional regulator [Anaerocolumna sedimenticola]QHQ63732.1 helix-turn-helix domain-containing protein [Anaerocolumna sedimenticola]
MSLQKCELNLNHAKMELQPHGTLEFPCAGYLAQLKDRPEDIIPWHWHEEMEIVYVKSGQLKQYIPTKMFNLEQGDCIILNSRTIHHAVANPECEINSIVFSSNLITGSNDSIFARKYILPLISSASFDGYKLSTYSNEIVISKFNRAFDALVNDSLGYEFVVRENLSSLCFDIYRQFAHEIAIGDIGLNQDNLRLRKMIDYIHKNYFNDIFLEEIAKVVDISERECLRCFQRTIQLSPIQYLLKYRIMKGANMLIENPSSSISEIANLCGFDSPSNFSKLFKRFYNCTPKEYRISRLQN